MNGKETAVNVRKTAFPELRKQGVFNRVDWITLVIFGVFIALQFVCAKFGFFKGY